MISGCECWTEIDDYGKAKEQWLRGFFKSRRRYSFSWHIWKGFLYFRFWKISRSSYRMGLGSEKKSRYWRRSDLCGWKNPGVTHMTWAGDQQTKSSSGSYYPWQPPFAFFWCFFWWVLFLKDSKPFAWEENSFLTILQLIFCRHPRSSSHLNSNVAFFNVPMIADFLVKFFGWFFCAGDVIARLSRGHSSGDRIFLSERILMSAWASGQSSFGKKLTSFSRSVSYTHLTLPTNREV